MTAKRRDLVANSESIKAYVSYAELKATYYSQKDIFPYCRESYKARILTCLAFPRVLVVTVAGFVVETQSPYHNQAFRPVTMYDANPLGDCEHLPVPTQECLFLDKQKKQKKAKQKCNDTTINKGIHEGRCTYKSSTPEACLECFYGKFVWRLVCTVYLSRSCMSFLTN